MGVVWRALDLDLKRTVALKRSQVGDSGQIRREARIGAGLQHPNVITVFDTVSDGDERWLVMEYLPSRSLSDLEDVSPARAAHIGAQIALALAAMHAKGIAHRDVKPGNVLVTEDGTAKLSDLGIARWSEVTRTGGDEIAGTPGFVAPEVAAGHESSAAADVFALGATLFAAVEGLSPWGSLDEPPAVQFRRATAFELEPPRRAGELAPVLAELMRREPRDRPSAHRAAALLAEIAGDEPPPAPPRRRPSRRAVVTGAVVAVLALTAGVLAPKLFADRGTTGDPATMDLCALLDPDALIRFTPHPVEVGSADLFNQCDLFARMSEDENDVVHIALQIKLPNLYGAQPAKTGRLGPVKRHPEKDGSCSNDIPLPDTNWIQITSEHRDDRPVDLCGMVEAVSNNALLVLSQGPIPRLAAPHPPQSLVHVNVCDLLDDADLVRALDAEVPPYPELGGWSCSWDLNDKEIVIEVSRDDPLDPGDLDDRRRDATVGGRDAVVDSGVTAWPKACMVKVEHRRSHDHPPTDEFLYLFYENDDLTDPEPLCPGAIALAEAAVSRLPAP